MLFPNFQNMKCIPGKAILNIKDYALPQVMRGENALWLPPFQLPRVIALYKSGGVVVTKPKPSHEQFRLAALVTVTTGIITKVKVTRNLVSATC